MADQPVLPTVDDYENLSLPKPGAPAAPPGPPKPPQLNQLAQMLAARPPASQTGYQPNDQLIPLLLQLIEQGGRQ